MNRAISRSVGLIFWVALITVGFAASYSARSTRSSTVISELGRFFRGQVDNVSANDTTGRVRVGDPVFYRDAASQWRQVGFVKRGPMVTATC